MWPSILSFPLQLVIDIQMSRITARVATAITGLTTVVNGRHAHESSMSLGTPLNGQVALR